MGNFNPNKEIGIGSSPTEKNDAEGTTPFSLRLMYIIAGAAVGAGAGIMASNEISFMRPEWANEAAVVGAIVLGFVGSRI